VVVDGAAPGLEAHPRASDDRWYRERLLPSLRPWLDLPIQHVLVAQSPLVPREELAAALDRPPDRGL
jgi:hypothetical protein